MSVMIKKILRVSYHGNLVEYYDITCKGCGKKYSQPKSTTAHRKFCTQTCKSEYLKDRCNHCHKTENIIRSKNDKNHRICRNCNTLRMKKYRATSKGIIRVRVAVAKSTRKYPEKQKSRYILNKAVIRGVLVKPNMCEGCGFYVKLQAHHKDYSKPLEVVWLCSGCHGDVHKLGFAKAISVMV